MISPFSKALDTVGKVSYIYEHNVDRRVRSRDSDRMK